jgi:hypothetical protein
VIDDTSGHKTVGTLYPDYKVLRLGHMADIELLPFDQHLNARMTVHHSDMVDLEALFNPRVIDKEQWTTPRDRNLRSVDNDQCTSHEHERLVGALAFAVRVLCEDSLSFCGPWSNVVRLVSLSASVAQETARERSLASDPTMSADLLHSAVQEAVDSASMLALVFSVNHVLHQGSVPMNSDHQEQMEESGCNGAHEEHERQEEQEEEEEQKRKDKEEGNHNRETKPSVRGRSRVKARPLPLHDSRWVRVSRCPNAVEACMRAAAIPHSMARRLVFKSDSVNSVRFNRSSMCHTVASGVDLPSGHGAHPKSRLSWVTQDDVHMEDHSIAAVSDAVILTGNTICYNQLSRDLGTFSNSSLRAERGQRAAWGKSTSFARLDPSVATWAQWHTLPIILQTTTSKSGRHLRTTSAQRIMREHQVELGNLTAYVHKTMERSAKRMKYGLALLTPQPPPAPPPPPPPPPPSHCDPGVQSEGVGSTDAATATCRTATGSGIGSGGFVADSWSCIQHRQMPGLDGEWVSTRGSRLPMLLAPAPNIPGVVVGEDRRMN